MAVSKRIRFEILKRDKHTCRYCGDKAPDVKVQVDHVVPESLGGTNDPSNLVTACEGCNSGKSSSSPDATLVADVSQSAARWSAAIQQAAEESKLHDNTTVYESVVNAWTSYRRNQIPGDYRETIDQFLAAGLPADDIVQMAHVADSKPSIYNRWSYFCGCCWTRIRQLQERAMEIMAQEPEPAPVPVTAREMDFKTIWYGNAWNAGHRGWWRVADQDLEEARADSIARGLTPADQGYVNDEGMIYLTRAPRPLGFFDDVDYFLSKGLTPRRIEMNVAEAMVAPVDHVDRWSYFRGCCRRDLVGSA